MLTVQSNSIALSGGALEATPGSVEFACGGRLHRASPQPLQDLNGALFGQAKSGVCAR